MRTEDNGMCGVTVRLGEVRYVSVSLPGLSFPLTLCCRGRGIRCAMVPKMQTVSWADDFRVHLVEGHASSTFALSHYTNQQFVDVED